MEIYVKNYVNNYVKCYEKSYGKSNLKSYVNNKGHVTVRSNYLYCKQ